MAETLWFSFSSSISHKLELSDLSATEAFNSELLSTLSASFAVSFKPIVPAPTASTVSLDALSSEIFASKTRLLSFSSSSISSDFSSALSFSRSSGPSETFSARESLPETLCFADLSVIDAFNSELLSTLSSSLAVSFKPMVRARTASIVSLEALSSEIFASKTRLLSFSSSSISSDFSSALSFSRRSGPMGSFSGRALLIRMR